MFLFLLYSRNFISFLFFVSVVDCMAACSMIISTRCHTSASYNTFKLFSNSHTNFIIHYTPECAAIPSYEFDKKYQKYDEFSQNGLNKMIQSDKHHTNTRAYWVGVPFRKYSHLNLHHTPERAVICATDKTILHFGRCHVTNVKYRHVSARRGLCTRPRQHFFFTDT